VDATSANTASKVVARDASGNFSASTITATLSGTASNISGQANSATITAATAATGSTIVLRDSSGDINVRYGFASYFNSTDDTSSSTVSFIMAKFGDNYIRSASATKVATFISGQSMNISGNATNVTGVVAVANGGTGLSSTPSNGQLDIGNGSGFTRAALTAGTGISISNGSGSITITSTVAGGSQAFLAFGSTGGF
jgi:hypothetical protein